MAKSTKLESVFERSTKFIDVGFLDEADAEEDPKTLTWTLSDPSGKVIGALEDQVVASPSSSETIVLSDGALALFGSEDDGKRLFTAKATYDSTLGNDLPLKGQADFTIINLPAIENEDA